MNVSDHLVVVDMQRVFGEPTSEWFTPRFAEALPQVLSLARAYAPRVTCTRFVAPVTSVGAWTEYYAQFPFALQPADSPIYQLVDGLAEFGQDAIAATTFGKWGPELADRVGSDDMLLAGVATECCVLSTALAAADAGVRVRVVADACAGATDESHRQALSIMRLYAPLIEIVSTADLTS